MYQCSDRGFTDKSVHCFVLLGSVCTEMLQLLYWDDREQLPVVYTAVGTVDMSCPLHLCVELNKHYLGSLAITLLGLLEPWLMYFTLFWGQCDFSGGRVEDFQTTAFQWIDSASPKVISAGETIPTLVPGRQSWCQAAGVMFPCGWTSAAVLVLLHPPRQLPPCALPACCVCWHCTALCTSHFYTPSPSLQWDLQLPQTLVCWADGSSWTPVSMMQRPPWPWGTLSRDASGFCGSSPFCWSYSGSLSVCTIWQTGPLLAQWLQ